MESSGVLAKSVTAGVLPDCPSPLAPSQRDTGGIIRFRLVPLAASVGGRAAGLPLRQERERGGSRCGTRGSRSPKTRLLPRVPPPGPSPVFRPAAAASPLPRQRGPGDRRREGRRAGRPRRGETGAGRDRAGRGGADNAEGGRRPPREGAAGVFQRGPGVEASERRPPCPPPPVPGQPTPSHPEAHRGSAPGPADAPVLLPPHPRAHRSARRRRRPGPDCCSQQPPRPPPRRPGLPFPALPARADYRSRRPPRGRPPPPLHRLPPVPSGSRVSALPGCCRRCLPGPASASRAGTWTPTPAPPRSPRR